jgi:AraC-like DNA-binding protein
MATRKRPSKSKPGPAQPPASALREQVERHRMTPTELRLLTDPLRECLVNSLVAEAKPVARIAAELGCAPTRLYRHIQLLLEAGILVIEREVRVRGVVEHHYRSVAETFPLDRDRFAWRDGVAPEGLDAILDYVFDQTRTDIANAVRAGRTDPAYAWPDARSVLAWRAVARVTPTEAAALRRKARELYDEVERYARRRAPRGEMVSFAVALGPCDPVGQRARKSPRRKQT